MAAATAALLASVVDTLTHIQTQYTQNLASMRLPDKKNERAYYKALDRHRELEHDIASLAQAIAYIQTHSLLHYTHDPRALFAASLPRVAPVASGAFGTVDIVLHPRTGKRYYRKIVGKGHVATFADCMQELAMNRFVTTRIPDAVSRLEAGRIHIVPTTRTVYFEQLFEYLPGSDIVTYSERHRITKDEAVRIYCMAMRAIEALHSVGIVHRDIKPDNLFLETDADGVPVRVRLIDFGASEYYSAKGRFLARGTPNYSRYNLMFRDPSKDLYTGHLSYQNDKDAMDLFWRQWMGSATPAPACASHTAASIAAVAEVPLPVSPAASLGGGGTRRRRRQTRRRAVA